MVINKSEIKPLQVMCIQSTITYISTNSAKSRDKNDPLINSNPNDSCIYQHPNMSHFYYIKNIRLPIQKASYYCDELINS